MTVEYPGTPRIDCVERLHGRDVSDPYRWLEETGDDAAQDWIDAQNAVAERWLSQVPERSAIRQRLRALWDLPRAGVPFRHGKIWLQLRNTGLQDQDVLWAAEAPDAEGRVLLDPNGLSEDATTSLTGAAVTDDGALLAYGLSEQGSDWRVWRVREVATGVDLPDRVEWSKLSPAAWHPDGSGFWYSAYDAPTPGTDHVEATRGQRLAFHRLGTEQAEDEVVCELPGEHEWIFEPSVTDDGRWLVVTLWRGTERRSRVWVADLSGDGTIRPLLDRFDARYECAGGSGDTLYFLTDAGAPRGRVIAVAASEDTGPGQAPPASEVVGQRDETLERALVAGGRLVTLWLADASSRLRRHRLDGREEGEVDLPGLGSVEGVSGHFDDDVVHFSFAGFARPTAIHRHDLATGETVETFAPELPGDPSDVLTERVLAIAADGTRVPMFLVRRRDREPGEPHPTLLWGYGGFNIPVTPTFRAHWHVWVERGGVLAVANLRGGGEYGRQWHDDGRLQAKQHVFDDAVACAEWLIASGWTTPERLAVKGRSNGGLLAGACLTQRPDLFGAAVVEVGVLDMLRFHLSTVGWAWKSDYGDPDDPEAFAALLAYSPYHNVRPGTVYPATLVTTGDHDDRVVPSHSFKFAAALQAAQAGSAPVLLRVDRSGGHGVGKPVAKVIDERADVLAFLTRALGASDDKAAEAERR